MFDIEEEMIDQMVNEYEDCIEGGDVMFAKQIKDEFYRIYGSNIEEYL